MSLDPRTIAQIMGGDVIGRDSINVPGPGHSRSDRSLSIKINPAAPGGFVVFSHCGDDPIECRDYVRAALGLGSFDPRSKHSVTPLSVTIANGDKDLQRRKDFAEKIWRQSVSPVGSVVEKYLKDARGLHLLPTVVLSVIRYHGALRYGDQTFPGMVCLMRNIFTNEPCGIHRTFLTSEGQKVDRRMLGVAKGAAIKIDAHAEINGGLTIGEGFETAYASKLAGFGHAWALGSANAIQSFPLLERVTELTLLEERDATSRKAVKACAKRYLEGKRPVNVVEPKVGNDFNDVWLEAQK